MNLIARARGVSIGRILSLRERQLRLLVLAVAIGGVVAVWLLRGEILSLEAAAYPGIFFLSFLGSVALVVPVPGIVSVCAGGSALNPVFVGLVAGTAETLGEISGYMIGYGGRAVIERQRLYNMMCAWMERRGALVLFLVSLIPNPIFDLVGIAAGGLRFPIHRFLAAVLVGKVLKSLGISYGCLFGINVVKDFFG